MKILNIGLFGFGCVGQGLYYVLNHSTGFKANIKKIGVKNRDKKRIVSAEMLTYDKYEILNDPEIDVVVELIDDATEAFDIVKTAIRNGKHVVTANKKMLALHLKELFDLQEKHQVSLLYEASACGSIPIIRTLEEYFDNENLVKVSGIFNGTTNYILTKTIEEKLSYPLALKQAQDAGFAESDPTNDVEGFDAKFKTAILALHAFGIIIEPKEIINIGISELSEFDINFAAEKSYKIKLLPVIEKIAEHQITAYVIPHFISKKNNLYKVENEFNGVIVEGEFSGEQFFQGRGAGRHPTGSAVLSDISALSYQYRYSFKKHEQNGSNLFTRKVNLKIYLRIQTKEDLAQINFIEILSEYYSEDYSYVLAMINLEELFLVQNYLKEKSLFCAVVGE